MRNLFKKYASFFLIPITQWYLRKERTYRFRKIIVSVVPGVFHPGLFYSTKFLLEFIEALPLQGKTVLELGCGSGLISIVSAGKGAIVTASDISPNAIENSKRNSLKNQVSIECIHSDLFENIPRQQFDFIFINPPYYANDPKDETQYAWYCGKDFRYFRKLFDGLPEYTNTNSVVVMVLTKGSDISSIQQIAKSKAIEFELLREKNVLFDEKDYLFRLRTASRI